MRFSKAPAYKNRLLEHVALHPDVSRALRASVAFAIPLMVCHWLGRPGDALFIAMPAQTLSLQDLRGAYRVRLSILGAMSVIAAGSVVLGVMTSGSALAATLTMGGIALLGGVWRHLSSEYGPAFSISSAFLFLLGLTQEGGWPAGLHMAQSVLLGCAIATGLHVAFWIVRPQHPLRYAVAETWVAASDLLAAMRPEAEIGNRGHEDHIVSLEGELRASLDRTFKILGAAETRQTSTFLAKLEEARREVVHLSMRAIAFHDSLEKILSRPESARSLPILEPLWKALSEMARSVAINLILYRPENFAVLNVRLLRCEQFTQILDEQIAALPENPSLLDPARATLAKITGVLPRIRSALSATMDQRVARFNFPATLPELGARSIQSLAAWTDPAPQLDPVLIRYTARMAALTMLAVLLYKGCAVPRGYWIALTIIVVLQPDYGATRQRAGARIWGTVAGTVLASALLWVKMPLLLLDTLAALTSFGFAYFLKQRYGWAVFFVTLMIVLITETTAPVHLDFTIVRLIATLAGAGLALIGALVFWPVWERKNFSALLAEALRANQKYLQSMSGPPATSSPDLLMVKRRAENANRFASASLQKLLQEPNTVRENAERAEALTVYSHRVTRALTGLAVHLDDKTRIDDPDLSPIIRETGALLENMAHDIEEPQTSAGQSDPCAQIRNLEAAFAKAQTTAGKRSDNSGSSSTPLIWNQYARLLAEIRVMILTLKGSPCD